MTDVARGVADGSGMIWWIDPYRGLHMVENPYDSAPFSLGVGTIANPETQKTRDRYVNVMRVTCTGINGNKVTIERSDSAQIAARQAIEGRTGRYELAAAINHPSSDVGADLQRLATSYAVIQLKKSGAIGQQLRGMVYQAGLKVGMTVIVTLPTFDAAGTWVITNVRQQHRSKNDWQWEVNAVATSALELAIDYYLKTVQTGKATVQLPIGLYANLVQLTTTQSWIVPGSGDVDVEIDCYGSGGGGGGYDSLGVGGVTPVLGGNGGNGGLASTFITVPAGTSIDVVVPAIPTGGVGAEPPSVVTFTSSTTWTVPGTGNVRVQVYANGGGGGGSSGASPSSGSSGGSGGAGGRGIATRVYPAGTVLTLTVGAGGTGGVWVGPFGFVNGTNGGSTDVSVGGSSIASGQGGAGSVWISSPLSSPPGGDGTGSGDSAVTGGGSAGGAGGAPGGNGSNGAVGSVVIHYADSDPGQTGSAVTASVGGVLKASALSGIGGAAGCDGGALGANQGGTGDQVVVGGGGTGGNGGHSGSPNGQPGTAGKVQIRY